MTVLCIVGPTAAGKTRIAIKLASRIGGQIISADSMQVYKGMAILSQSPTSAQKRMARHYLVNFIDPEEEFSAAEFVRLAAKAIRRVIKRKKVPVIVGGTGLYVKALIDGLFPSPPADMKFRQRMERYAIRYGDTKLYERLKKIDPESARMIHPNDRRRVIRALEVFHSTGRTMAELKSCTHGIKEYYDIMMFGITKPRDELYSAAEKRVDGMFESGAIREVRRLSKRKLSKTAKGVLGYKEIVECLGGIKTEGEAKELLKMNTRRFVKRQLTWFKTDKRVRWLNMSELSDGGVVNKIANELKRRNKDD